MEYLEFITPYEAWKRIIGFGGPVRFYKWFGGHRASRRALVVTREAAWDAMARHGGVRFAWNAVLSTLDGPTPLSAVPIPSVEYEIEGYKEDSFSSKYDTPIYKKGYWTLQQAIDAVQARIAAKIDIVSRRYMDSNFELSNAESDLRNILRVVDALNTWGGYGTVTTTGTDLITKMQVRRDHEQQLRDKAQAKKIETPVAPAKKEKKATKAKNRNVLDELIESMEDYPGSPVEGRVLKIGENRFKAYRSVVYKHGAFDRGIERAEMDEYFRKGSIEVIAETPGYKGADNPIIEFIIHPDDLPR